MNTIESSYQPHHIGTSCKISSFNGNDRAACSQDEIIGAELNDVGNDNSHFGSAEPQRQREKLLNGFSENDDQNQHSKTPNCHDKVNERGLKVSFHAIPNREHITMNSMNILPLHSQLAVQNVNSKNPVETVSSSNSGVTDSLPHKSNFCTCDCSGNCPTHSILVPNRTSVQLRVINRNISKTEESQQDDYFVPSSTVGRESLTGTQRPMLSKRSLSSEPLEHDEQRQINNSLPRRGRTLSSKNDSLEFNGAQSDTNPKTQDIPELLTQDYSNDNISETESSGRTSGSFVSSDGETDDDEQHSSVVLVSNYIKDLIRANRRRAENIFRHHRSLQELKEADLFSVIPKVTQTVTTTAKSVMEGFRTCCAPRKKIEYSVVNLIELEKEVQYFV